MIRKPIPPTLDIGDPLDFWVKQAHKLISELRLPAEFILEARAIAEGAFKNKWLDVKIKKEFPHESFLPRVSHPLVFDFTVAGDSRIVEIMELAIYLKKFVGDKNLGAVIDAMKNSFQAGLL